MKLSGKYFLTPEIVISTPLIFSGNYNLDTRGIKSLDQGMNGYYRFKDTVEELPPIPDPFNPYIDINDLTTPKSNRSTYGTYIENYNTSYLYVLSPDDRGNNHSGIRWIVSFSKNLVRNRELEASIYGRADIISTTRGTSGQTISNPPGLNEDFNYTRSTDTTTEAGGDTFFSYIPNSIKSQIASGIYSGSYTERSNDTFDGWLGSYYYLFHGKLKISSTRTMNWSYTLGRA